MTNRSYDVQGTELLFKNLRHPTVDLSKNLSTFVVSAIESRSEAFSEGNAKALHGVLHRLAVIDLPGKEHVKEYIRSLYRRNIRPRTYASPLIAIYDFLNGIRDSGKTRLEEITKNDIEVFIALCLDVFVLGVFRVPIKGIITHRNHVSMQETQACYFPGSSAC